MKERSTKLDATGPHLWPGSSTGKCTIPYIEVTVALIRRKMASGGAGDAITTSTMEPSTEKSSTRRSRRRAHFVSSAMPLKEGEAYEVLCGATVERSRFLFQLDLENKQPIPTFAVCGDCFKALTSNLVEEFIRRYIYAIISEREWGERKQEEAIA